MRPPDLTMTFDYGTTSLKAALVDRQGGIVASASATYAVAQPRVGWAEQDPRLLWEAGALAGREAMRLARAGPEAVRSIVFVAPWKGIIPVSQDGAVLRDALIWMDARAAPEAGRLNAALGVFAGTGQEYWPRLMWLKQHEPRTWAGSRWIMGVGTYLRWMATGAVVTEPSDDFVRSTRPATQARFDRILAAAGLSQDLDKFPPAIGSGDVVGALTPEAAGHLGFLVGTPVRCGFGDLPAITLGAGPLEPGAVHIYLGTSSWFAAVLEAGSELDPPLRFAIDAHHDGALYCLQAGCLAYDWVVDLLYRSDRAEKGDRFFAFMDDEISAVPPGSETLLATHWLIGELPPFAKNAKGVYLNLTTIHDRRHMVRAMLESICYSHRLSVERYEAQAGCHVDEIRAVGGGASSPVWMQMLADVLSRPIVVPAAPRFVGAIGASRCAGERRVAPAPVDAPTQGRRFTPNPDHRSTYDRMFAAYAKIQPALVDLFDALNGPSITQGERT
ncbi:FGGY family carbohydrate kinase [Lichenihabitans sp. Uapishka_5]|uniref:xylulokinase n=1 Tax=Lichenihabitans sp. Uapishka_5 TaxID=3037302 RepID=UPI0029E7CC1C|nr:FGGY family carbohydrate kinase [Lichenihabitans sp. Uapishka_5]MDX7951377.1 FGGY family carbohydrate kinase [Lichenihabitans sp. Uapishka_5]